MEWPSAPARRNLAEASGRIERNNRSGVLLESETSGHLITE
jgi:hypothetical protein